MADKGFGVKELNLIGASGTPTIVSPNNLNLNAISVAISTDLSVGRKITSPHIEPQQLNVTGVSTFAGIATVTGTTFFSKQINASGISTFNSSVNVVGSLSKGSGSFNIPHPILDGKRLVHSFVESPKADLIYRGIVKLSAGTATINLDEVVGLSTGTWAALCREPQLFLQNNYDWTQVKGEVSAEGVITINAKTSTSAALVNWMVVAERKDKHMYDTEWTDNQGRPILEPDTTF